MDKKCTSFNFRSLPIITAIRYEAGFLWKAKNIYVFSLYLIFVYKCIGWTIVAELSFDRLYEYFAKVPSIQKNLIDAYGFEIKRPFNKTKFNRMTVGSYNDDMRIKKISDTEIDLYVYKGISEEETDFLTVRLNLLDANESQNDNEYFSLNNRNPFYVSTFHNSSRY